MLTSAIKRYVLHLSDSELREFVELHKHKLLMDECCKFATAVLSGRDRQRVVGWTYADSVKRTLAQVDVDAMTAAWAACARTEQDTEYREQLALEFGEASALDFMQREQAFRAAMRDVMLY